MGRKYDKENCNLKSLFCFGGDYCNTVERNSPLGTFERVVNRLLPP